MKENEVFSQTQSKKRTFRQLYWKRSWKGILLMVATDCNSQIHFASLDGVGRVATEIVCAEVCRERHVAVFI